MSQFYLRTLKSRDDLERIANMSSEELDDLPIGAIQLDEDGTILRFNEKEARLSGRDAKRVVGKNFFTEVAPCTNVQEFAGRFREGVQQRNLHATFPYKFDFKMEPTDVWVSLFWSEATESAWVFVQRREGES